MENRTNEIKIGFVTCVQLGKICIEEILRIGGKLQLIITLPDDYAKDKSGRIYLDELAKKAEASLLKVRNINDQRVVDIVRENEIDWLFIVGWSQIAKKSILEAPKKGCIGMHPTLLPEGRGRASIPWAILKKLERTGVTMFKIDEGVDTGDIIGQDIVEMYEGINATELYMKIATSHLKLINHYWQEIIGDKIAFHKQDEKYASIWPQRRPEDGKLERHMTMEEADLLVRAVTHPYPGAFIKENGIINRIWKATVHPKVGTYRLSDGFLTPIEYVIEDTYEE